MLLLQMPFNADVFCPRLQKWWFESTKHLGTDGSPHPWKHLLKEEGEGQNVLASLAPWCSWFSKSTACTWWLIPHQGSSSEWHISAFTTAWTVFGRCDKSSFYRKSEWKPLVHHDFTLGWCFRGKLEILCHPHWGDAAKLWWFLALRALPKKGSLPRQVALGGCHSANSIFGRWRGTLRKRIDSPVASEWVLQMGRN